MSERTYVDPRQIRDALTENRFQNSRSKKIAFSPCATVLASQSERVMITLVRLVGKFP